VRALRTGKTAAPEIIDGLRHETKNKVSFKELGDMGLLGVTVPRTYGGLGALCFLRSLVARESERVAALPVDDVRCNPAS